MRSFEEINTEFEAKRAINDGPAMRTLAQEFTKLGTAEALAMAEFAEGRCYLVTGEYSRALGHWERALAAFEELGDRTGVGRTICNIGNVYWRTSDYPKAIEHYHRALVIHEDLGDRNDAAIAIGNIGNVYYNTGDYERALQHYRRALEIHEELDDLPGIARLTGSLANVYMYTSDHPLAMEHYHRTVSLYEKLGDRAGLALFTCNLGSLYDTTGDAQQALACYHRALAVHEELGDRSGVALVTMNLGILYSNTGDLQKGLEHQQRALTMYKELGDRSSITWITGNIINIFLREDRIDEAVRLLDDQASMVLDDPKSAAANQSNRAKLAEHAGDLDGAVEYLKLALSIVDEAGMRLAVSWYHKRLRDLAQQRNDFAGYIEHNNEYQRINEEIQGKAAIEKIAMMAADRKNEAELRERDKERALLYNTLPKAVADRMIQGKDTGDHFDNAALLFLDVVGFTSHTSTMPPEEVVDLLESIFSSFDAMCEHHAVIKIKTIGDSYMCFRGDADMETNARSVAAVALDALSSTFTWPSGEPLLFRAGAHIGAASAGVIGTQRLQYDVWGDTVNVASRMESTGEPGRIHVSEAFAIALGQRPQELQPHDAVSSPFPVPCSLRVRGALEIKGKGTMTTYWLEQTC